MAGDLPVAAPQLCRCPIRTSALVGRDRRRLVRSVTPLIWEENVTRPGQAIVDLPYAGLGR
ncbi:hypothetical protein EDC02_0477 [Micromonospora sp. Llam0]|nr:hypothetical protein EDC02_0477 [Micromonospora sp. Llam0]